MKNEEARLAPGFLRDTKDKQILDLLRRASSRASNAIEFLPLSLRGSPLARRHVLDAIERAFLDAAFNVARARETQG
jgi:hypothetical protein